MKAFVIFNLGENPLRQGSMPPEKDCGVLESELDEVTILMQARDGDREAFGQLYERYVGRIYNYIYYRTGNTYEAEDLTERVFFRALRHIGNYDHRGLPFSAWLYRIAHNLVANWHRDNSRRKEVPLDDVLYTAHLSSHPEYELMQLEEHDRLLAVIRDLPPERQQLLILKFVDRLSNAEIGQVMGRTEGAVKSLYHRTLLSVRDELDGLMAETAVWETVTGTTNNGNGKEGLEAYVANRDG